MRLLVTFLVAGVLVPAFGFGGCPDDGIGVAELRWVDPMGRRPMEFECWRQERRAELDESAIGCVVEAGNSNVVDIVVGTGLYQHIESELGQYRLDLEAAGYSVRIDTMRGMSETALRAHLAGVPSIRGAVFIGELPVAWYELDAEEFPADIFFMDLDGVWHDRDQDGLYDDHTGDMGLEIWVGRIDARPLTWDDEVRLTRRYFAKNHLYRTGGLGLPDRALSYVDDDWRYFDDCDLRELYSDVVVVTNRSTTRASDYRTRLGQGYEWVHLCSHSCPWGHTFADNAVYVGTVFNTEVYATRPRVHFYNLFCCSGTRYVEENCSAGWDVFQDDWGLLAVGSSKTGAMKSWFYDFYRPMAYDSSIGAAFLCWYNLHGESDRFWHYGLNLVGDPSLVPRTGHTGQVSQASPGQGEPVDAEVICSHIETDDSPALVCMPNGDVWATWKSGRSSTNGRFDIFASLRTGSGWSSAYSVGPHEYWDTDPVLGIDRSGRPVAVWANFTEDYQFELFSSTWNGSSWTGRVRVSTDNSSDLDPCLARDSSGLLWCFWTSRRELDADVCAASHDGSSWGPTLNLTSDSIDELYPQCATMPDGTVWVVYARCRDQRSEVWARYRSGQDWIETGPVSGSQVRALRPAVAAGPDGRPVVCWQGFDAGSGDVWWSQFDGAIWRTPDRVDAHPGLDVLPAMARDRAGSAWVVWMSDRSGNWDVCCSHFSAGGWVEAQFVDTSPGPDVNPAVAASSGGDVWVAWQNLNEANWDILAKPMPATGCVAEAPDADGWVMVSPSLFREGLRIQSPAGFGKVTILNVDGRTIRELGAGRGEVIWDAKDDAGTPVPSGVYFVQIEAGRGGPSRRPASGGQRVRQKVLCLR